MVQYRINYYSNYSKLRSQKEILQSWEKAESIGNKAFINPAHLFTLSFNSNCLYHHKAAQKNGNQPLPNEAKYSYYWRQCKIL